MVENVFLKNIERRMIDIAVQTTHASEKGISNQAKSGYYRFAILLACTIAEGVLFKIVKKHLDETGSFIGSSITYKNPHHIPNGYLINNSVLCIQVKENISLSSQTKFSELIKYANINKLISDKRKNGLEKAMKLRNKIHIQSLDGEDNGYTKKKLDDIFNVINYLMEKI